VGIQMLKFTVNTTFSLLMLRKLQASTTSLSSFQCKLKFSLFSHPYVILPHVMFLLHLPHTITI